jgi:hypothetical protein
LEVDTTLSISADELRIPELDALIPLQEIEKIPDSFTRDRKNIQPEWVTLPMIIIISGQTSIFLGCGVEDEVTVIAGVEWIVRIGVKVQSHYTIAPWTINFIGRGFRRVSQFNGRHGGELRTDSYNRAGTLGRGSSLPFQTISSG